MYKRFVGQKYAVRARGRYSPKTNEITIDKKDIGVIKFVHILAHELTHWALQQTNLERHHHTLDCIDWKVTQAMNATRRKAAAVAGSVLGERAYQFVLCGYWIPFGTQETT
jgi:hypothetical protein